MTPFEWIAVAVVATLSASRITRLVTWDQFPPSAWVRSLWDRVTKDGSWSLLVHCGYCFAVWAAFGVVLWGYYTDWNFVWWLVNGSLAVSYAAAVFMANDGDDA